MGTREPGALTKAIDQLRIDLAEADTELRTTYVDFDALLVVLDAVHEVAVKEFVQEWLNYGATVIQSGDQIAIDGLSDAFMRGLNQIQAPFEYDMPPKESPVDVVCGAISFDGNLSCDRAEGHTEDHGVKTPEGQVLWARMCRKQRSDLMPDGTVVICDRDAGHEDDSHYDSAQGVAW